MPYCPKEMSQEICNYYCYRKDLKPVKIKIKRMDKLELVVFDMDGVIADIVSSWKFIHDYFHTDNMVSVEEYLKGNIDDMEFIRRDVLLWKENGKHITKNKLEEILLNVPLMKGAKDCMNALRNNNIKTVIVSAGLDILANRFQDELSMDYALSNGVKVDENGRLNGVGVLGVKLKKKDESIKKIATKFNINQDRIASVGNSCFDIPMFEQSGYGIAFNPEDDCVKKAADIVIEKKDLSLLLPLLKKYF